MWSKKEKNIFVIFGTSGSGQDSVILGLIKKGLPIERVVTTVTRKKRKGERQGKPYYFVSVANFKEMLKKKMFVEWARVYGDYRGCTYSELARVQKSKKIVIWKMDFQGALMAQKKISEAVTIYIKPPSLGAALQRLRKRGLDSEEVIQVRKEEMKKCLKKENDRKFDYVVINKEGKLSETVMKVKKIIIKELN